MQIANLFLETAENERAHAFQFFSLLEGGMPEFTASYPAGPVGTTAENLLRAAEGELRGVGHPLPGLCRCRPKRKGSKGRRCFRRIAGVEKYHERRYRKLLANVEAKQVFRKAGPTLWKCRMRVQFHEGDEAPRCARCAASPGLL